MDKLYSVILTNQDLEFRFIIRTSNKENAEAMAIEHLVDSDDYNNVVLSSKTVKVEEIDNNCGIISFNCYQNDDF